MSARPEPSVLWREGMFLGPQHMQAFARELHARLHRGDGVGNPGTYGLLRFAVDEEALSRDVFKLLDSEVVFKDGTSAIFPDTAAVDSREFAAFFTGAELDVWLGVPAPRPGVPQISLDGDRATRYRVQVSKVSDENEREADTELEFRELQARVFFGDEDRSGYECVPIARLVRRGKPVAKSVLSGDYVPPILACGASAVVTSSLAELAEMARSQARDLASRLPSTAGLSSVEKGADIAGFVKLEAVNRTVASLDQLAHLPVLHPYDVYLGLAQVVGNLAVFGEERVMPKLPVYDHARTDECFRAVFAAIRALLVAEVAVPYDLVTFKKDALREGFLECEIPKEWIDRQPLVYLAVAVAKPAEEVAELVGWGVKLVSGADIERVLQGVVPGIELSFERMPPTSFPKRADLHFFFIETEGASRDTWLNVLKARSAVLLSTLGFLGDIQYHLYVELRR